MPGAAPRAVTYDNVSKLDERIEKMHNKNFQDES
jgi:hypothetical protein